MFRLAVHKISHYKPAATQPTAATQATTGNNAGGSLLSRYSNSYAGNYTWDNETSGR